MVINQLFEFLLKVIVNQVQNINILLVTKEVWSEVEYVLNRGVKDMLGSLDLLSIRYCGPKNHFFGQGQATPLTTEWT